MVPAFPKVLFVTGTLGIGGAERQLFYMAEALHEAGAAPEVVVLTRGEYWEGRLGEIGVPVHHVGSNLRPERARRIAQLARRLDVDVVQSSHFYTNLYAALAGRVARRPEIGAVRNETRKMVELLGIWGKWSLRVPRVLAVNSTRAIEQAIALGVPPERLVYLPSVVDTCLFTPPEQRDPVEYTLLNVGRLVPAKRQDRFLRVLKRVIEALPDLKVTGTIMGDGPLRESLLRQAGQLELGSERLTFVTGPDALPQYRRAAVFLLTSDYEGTPNVILEAMATGLPVIGFDVGELSALVDSRVGRVLCPEDEDGMVETVVELGQDPERRVKLGVAGRERVSGRWSTEVLPQELERLYERVAAR